MDVANCNFDQLPLSCLEIIACFLETRSALNLLVTSKSVHEKLQACAYFWKQLCKNEGFDKYNALAKHDGDDILAWSGDKFHDIEIDDNAIKWQRIFQRGINMRRNIVSGRFEMWRLFMTNYESLPVKKMSWDTSSRELKRCHRNSPFNDQGRYVSIHSCWNENFLFVIKQNVVDHICCDIFVWSWKEYKSPEFLYSHDLLQLYPTGLFPTTFYLWKNFMVLMPETVRIPNGRMTSMIRVHDLNKAFQLVGSYDFPGTTRRHQHFNEVAHLHGLNDKAVALCRTPNFTFYIFSVPDCELLRSFSVLEVPARYLELDELSQMVFMKDNIMMFRFYEPDFFNNENPHQMKYGRLLHVEFDDYVKNNGKVEMRIADKFDHNDNYIETTTMVSNMKMVCVLASGEIVVKDIMTNNATTISFVEKLKIPCNEPLLDEEVERDGPSLCCGRNGNLIIALRHFISGRKIHAYNSVGDLLYEISIDLPRFALEKQPGYLSIDLENNFLCAVDQNRIVIWDSKNGRYVRTIMIPEHYNFKDDSEEYEWYEWKGHSGFGFSEDRIIIIHNQRNFPIAADVLLFW